MAEALLIARGLRFAYGEQEVIRGLDLTLNPGSFYGLVGPNGSGKTTLVDLLLSLKQPGEGDVLLEGRPVASYGRAELARRVALVPQDFAVGFSFPVRQVVLMGRHPHLPRFAAPTEEDWQAVDSAMARIEVTHLADKLVTRLSGGEKQRVALARALAQDTPMLFLDEPTSNLDVNHSLAALTAVEDLVRSRGHTVLAVMHDLNLAAAFCDRLIFLHSGRVAAAGPSPEVLTPQNLAAVFGVSAQVRWDDFAGCRVVVVSKEGGAP